MAAIVRIKRRINEEPYSAFVVNGKRRRLNDENSPAATTTPSTENKDELNQMILKFAGTLEKQDDVATKKFATARFNRAEAKELAMKNVDASIASAKRRDRVRQEQRQLNREQRYRVVNCLRTTLNDYEELKEGNQGQEQEEAAGSSQNKKSTDHRQFTIVDIESHQQQHQQTEQEAIQQLSSDQQQPADSDIGYVYDLYVPDNELQAQCVDIFDDNYLSLHPVNEIIFEDCYNDDEECDSEDSNEENYYTNDYPDDDEGSAMDSDEELCQQMNKFMFDDDDDEFGSGSSDAEDHNEYYDPYVHTVDADSASFVDDVDFFNVERRGRAYERYKRRILREVEGLNSEDSDDTEADSPFESACELDGESD